MNFAELERCLLAVARENPPSDAVPPGFAQRIMTHLRATPAADFGELWNQVFWRAAAPCVALMLLAGTWSWYSGPEPGVAETLEDELESVVCAPLNLLEDSW